nr:hypothetical protein [Massilia sp. 9096]
MSQHLSTIKTVVLYHSGYGHTERRTVAVADGSPDETSTGDLETARRYGARVAAIAAQFQSSRGD